MMESLFIAVAAILVVAIFLYFKTSQKIAPKTKEQKREEIISAYKAMIKSELDSISSESERVKRKSEILKKISKELSMNIFFDQDEIRDIIKELIVFS